ncbi:hypothetical protein MKO06_06130 [Gramella sp. GC03-9]|uniref:Uncharacterized protein n=1 Tax=Christiangramia oceanisediminis TaxID=2920386 RepID=A0A9X2I2I3_9FLAO|nr:hypothetical protein [Gramella oceanisediminis]MCP9199475.1 hypothetical protein [Gramella oceanisediminis]
MMVSARMIMNQNSRSSNAVSGKETDWDKKAIDPRTISRILPTESISLLAKFEVFVLDFIAGSGLNEVSSTSDNLFKE